MAAKTVIITGASRGIGYDTAELFAENGWNVAANYYQTATPTLALAERFPNVEAFRADISKREEAYALIRMAIERFGKADVLINNAGIAQQKLFTDITEEEWDRMFGVNVKGTMYCCQAVLRDMIRRKSGKIINVSSVWGQKGASCEVHYSASKAAVIGLTKALAKEVGLSGITVNCVAPGVIDTQMNRCHDEETMEALKEETPLNRLGSVRDVAQLLLFLASDKADFITGQVIGVNGGFGE